MIDRNIYLKMCQRCSMLESIAGTAINVPSDLLVKYKNIIYYPIGYEMLFNRDGVPIHSGILHDLKANCVVRANFQEIDYYESSK